MVDESQVRASLFVWLERETGRNGGIFTRKQLEDGFTFDGQRIALVGPTGIWKPRQFEEFPVMITTFHTEADIGAIACSIKEKKRERF